ncbi:hypothetical protein [Amycolatopsis sp. NPDC054798]
MIDGKHRILPAHLRSDTETSITRFADTDFEAFVQSVQRNVAHGRADREAAVLRIPGSRAAWPDRAIAEATGLSVPTVAAARSRATANFSQSHTRIGEDGRVRSLSRRAAAKIIVDRPGTPLREMAGEASMSMGTARGRLRRGDYPVPMKYSKSKVPGSGLGQPGPAGLRRDPALRFNAVARTLLQWLSICGMAKFCTGAEAAE